MPTEIAQAYEKGTRSYDGRPGENYWDNTVDYSIEVEIVPDEKKLKGSESVVYYNNSPDELRRVVIRLYHDVFRKANPRVYQVRPSDITDGVELSKIVIDGETYDLSDRRTARRNNSNLILSLKKPVPSGASLSMEIDWAFQIPETTIRTGVYDSTSFFIAYWYPQIAVYDDIFGWDNLAYDFRTEFYNNLANFDVKITAPKSFTVLSTGVLQNAKEVLPSSNYERYQAAKTSDETIAIVSPEDLENGLEHLSNIWHYEASEVTDFSFCLSDHFCWDAANQKVDDRNVLVNSFYPDYAANVCKEVTANQQKMMKHFSEDVPGIPYPYPEFTTFISSGRGGGGMETPMMANNGGPGLGVTIHEMFHTYFPMYVRTNEKRFAWMDEGWANFNTEVIRSRYFENEDRYYFGNSARSVQSTIGTSRDLPLITSSQFTDGSNYGYSAYPLPAFIYGVLHHHLGDEVFMRCYREYIRRWAKKAPSPYDFFYTFENVSGQDLAWFWKPWFFEFGNVDVGIKSYKKGKLILEKRGNRPVPITVRVNYKDGNSKMFMENAGIWQAGNTHKMRLSDHKEIKSFTVNGDVPDFDTENNSYPPPKDLYKGFIISDELLGVFHFPEYQIDVNVSKKEGKVWVDIPAANERFFIYPESNTSFIRLGSEDKLNFEMSDGKCTGLTVSIADFTITGKKE
ncbi:MAG: M1 family metallopeptidase [Bacteroidetes bacterium]|nr:M1 family metallopeptidase [Bacteroidota bacterium]